VRGVDARRPRRNVTLTPTRPLDGFRQHGVAVRSSLVQVRRVVTGHDADGSAVVASDELVDPVTVVMAPGSEFHRLWGGDAPPSFPDAGGQPSHVSYFPPIGGFRFGLFSVPPSVPATSGGGAPGDGGPELDTEAAVSEMESKLPGLAGHMEPDAPGMHTTATIDFEIVLDAEVWLELDGGVEVKLGPGDCVVQNGTRHAWRNHGAVPARLAVFIVGAAHAGVPPVG
jgi:hypothetical protein